MNGIEATLTSLMKALLLPPGGPLLLAIAGLVVLSRRPRTGRWLLGAGVGSLLLLSMPIVASALLVLASDAPAVDMSEARRAQAIVIPGGGVRRGAVEYGGDTAGRLTLERLRYGARLARETGLPVLVTGGSDGSTRSEAAVMRDVLERELGVPVRWVEDRSRNTRENAQRSAALLQPQGVRRVVLVGHSFDVRRSRYEFERAGLEVVAAPTLIPKFTVHGLLDFVPNAAAMQFSYYACYELLGYIVRRYLA